jgi:hypothetical protein
MELKDKTIIVTGASSGIGEAAARLFAAEGASLVLAARRGERLDALCGTIGEGGGRAVSLAGDVRDDGYNRALVELALATHGRLDGAFNNAGMMGEMAGVPDTSLDTWRDVLDTNLTSAFLAARHQVPAMLASGGGSILFTSTFVGHTAALPGMGAYAASKAGLIGLAQVLACEVGASGVRVNCLLPGGTRTAMAGDLENDPDRAAFIAGLHALKRIASPTEIANAAMFLLGDRASFVTGTAFLADGGNSISKV